MTTQAELSCCYTSSQKPHHVSADLAGLHSSCLPVWSATPGEESGLPLAVKTHTLGYEILSVKVMISCAKGCWHSKFIALIL